MTLPACLLLETSRKASRSYVKQSSLIKALVTSLPTSVASWRTAAAADQSGYLHRKNIAEDTSHMFTQRQQRPARAPQNQQAE